ncbi:MAG UNVERIFIED_CONTAM: LamB/YcsF family protein [Planctomycetaceae bacterium]|jgi:hypothetical protein
MNCANLNCDLGEHEDAAGRELENQLLPLVTSVNVACGGHAGSIERLAEVAAMCREFHTAFGAHPSFPDLRLASADANSGFLPKASCKVSANKFNGPPVPLQRQASHSHTSNPMAHFTTSPPKISGQRKS